MNWIRRHPHEYFCPVCGLLQDVDICSDCGTDEAMRGFLGMPTMRLDDWYSPPARSA